MAKQIFNLSNPSHRFNTKRSIAYLAVELALHGRHVYNKTTFSGAATKQPFQFFVEEEGRDHVHHENLDNLGNGYVIQHHAPAENMIEVDRLYMQWSLYFEINIL